MGNKEYSYSFQQPKRIDVTDLDEESIKERIKEIEYVLKLQKEKIVSFNVFRLPSAEGDENDFILQIWTNKKREPSQEVLSMEDEPEEIKNVSNAP